MSHTHKLVYAIIQFLKSQLKDESLSEDCAEGIEVGIQCLEAAYNLSTNEDSLRIPTGLLEIFSQYLDAHEIQQDSTPETKALAESLKNEGNAHMSAQNFGEAISCYTNAIKLDPKTAVYYCNRAAAENKLGHYESTIEDCKTALKLDPSYSKAYGRLGLAYSSLNRYQDAVDNYKRALELDPDNESYKSNLKMAQGSLESSSASTAPAPAQCQNPDLSMIFANPGLINMASQMLANPSMQHMMNSILTGNVNQEPGGAGMDVLLQASQQLAQQMEQENPVLVEQLRRHMSGGGGNNGGDNEDAEPPAPEPEGQ